MPVVARAYEVGPVADGGTVSGKILFRGAAPAPRKMLITKNTEVCGTGEREIVEVAVKNGALANAAVVVEGIARGKPWSAQLQKPLLDQKGCRFLPPMLLVRKGGELDIQNSDPVLHNIHSYEIIGTARRTLFNFGQPNQGQRLSKPVNVRRGELIKLECDAHDFMHAWMFAAASPYATLSGEDGAFSLGEVPPGTYKVRAVHPVLGVREAEVTVPAKGKAEVTFTFEAR
jgi:hypothetical protein